MLWSTRDMLFSSKTKTIIIIVHSDLFRSSHDCKCAAHDWLATATTLVHWDWQLTGIVRQFFASLTFSRRYFYYY